MKEDSPAVDVSIVVPCYQDAGHLRASVTEIYNLMNKTRYSFEMIFVDDCSKDNSKDVILSVCKDFPNTSYLFHEKNVGRGGAFMNGAKLARGKFVGFLDIDLEVGCVYLPEVILNLESGFDVVTVYRHYELNSSPVFIFRHILSSGYKSLVSMYLGIPKMDTETGFKFFKRDCLEKLAPVVENKKWFFDTEVMVQAYLHKYKIKEVDGLFIQNRNKTTTVKIVRDTIDYFRELWKFKKRLSNQKLS
jgi:glycosyltransferase involved in cell wall biosynthesis